MVGSVLVQAQSDNVLWVGSTWPRRRTRPSLLLRKVRDNQVTSERTYSVQVWSHVPVAFRHAHPTLPRTAKPAYYTLEKLSHFTRRRTMRYAVLSVFLLLSSCANPQPLAERSEGEAQPGS